MFVGANTRRTEQRDSWLGKYPADGAEANHNQELFNTLAEVDFQSKDNPMKLRKDSSRSNK